MISRVILQPKHQLSPRRKPLKTKHLQQVPKKLDVKIGSIKIIARTSNSKQYFDSILEQKSPSLFSFF